MSYFNKETRIDRKTAKLQRKGEKKQNVKKGMKRLITILRMMKIVGGKGIILNFQIQYIRVSSFY